jgi:hemin uptake protein HemP
MSNELGPTPSESEKSRSREDETRVVKAEELFRGEREVRIDYGGVCYRLRITRRNRLILQK